MLEVFNTISKSKEEFVPKDKNNVKFYSCGVTVYDDCHIGHGRSLYIFEIVRRYLEFMGYKVSFVRNITDVDDKIINKARDYSISNNIPLKESFDYIRKRYIDSYYRDLDALCIPKATFEPKATESISIMHTIIRTLLDKGYAYERDGNVYFSVRKFPSYGKLSSQNIDELLNAVRKDEDPLKIDPLDFALWKSAKKDEPFWESPWGIGRPGWHIECSAMIYKFLGETIDIHGGGRDLIFPHHENEIAQSEAFTGKPFCLYWLHHGLVTIDDQKMSKSLGNFITLKEFLDKYGSVVLKLIYLTSHYRNNLNFDEKKVEEAKVIKKRLFTFLNQIILRAHIDKDNYELKKYFDNSKLNGLYQKFIQLMNDDFNYVEGFSVIFDLIGIVNTTKGDLTFYRESYSLFLTILFLLGFDPKREFLIKENLDVYSDEVIIQKVKFRESLRREKKFKEADMVRQELFEQGIILEDQPDGTTIWYRL